MDESVVKEFEQQRVGKLKLSEAIRIGANLHPGKGTEYHDGCTLHCAALAVGEKSGTDAPKHWPMLDAPCPVRWKDPTGLRPDLNMLSLRTFISYLNGFTSGRGAFWPREQIADWLEEKGL